MKAKKLDEGLYQLDVKGYVCPHPQLYTMKMLQKLKSGDILEVLFDNPSSEESITALCNKEGHEIIERRSNGGTFVYRIKKA
ncbi:sulfurtransferase TusA family protein [Candidatus Pyrohabitans sp.]